MAKTHTIEGIEYEMEMVSDHALSITIGYATGYVVVMGQKHGKPVYGYTTKEDHLIPDDTYGRDTIKRPMRKSSNLDEIIKECAKKLARIDAKTQKLAKAMEGGADQLQSWE